MQTPEDIKRKHAMKGLVNIALMEGAMLILVIGAYLYTDDLNILIGGVIGTAIIFGPLFFRWFRQYGRSLQSKPGEGGHG
ncbi:MAG: hypothetical protein CMI63_09535 [Parvularcula sp.]|nr:hypothetical protein [Parvularcula sp.]